MAAEMSPKAKSPKSNAAKSDAKFTTLHRDVRAHGYNQTLEVRAARVEDERETRVFVTLTRTKHRAREGPETIGRCNVPYDAATLDWLAAQFAQLAKEARERA